MLAQYYKAPSVQKCEKAQRLRFAIFSSLLTPKRNKIKFKLAEIFTRHCN